MSVRKLTWSAEVKDNASKSIEGIDNKFSGLSGKMEKMAGTLDNMGGKMMKGVTLPLVGLGTAAIKSTSDFDDGMSKVRALTGATTDEFQAMREEAIRLGNDTAFSAHDAADGMQILSASGMEVNDILATSGDMLTLMSAGGVDAETSASVLTNTMAQFNLTAEDSERIIDGFAQGAASAKLGVDDLEYIMSQAGGTMASMNMDMEQSVAMAGQLANAGAPIGTIGTTLNAMGREIKANSKEFKALGIDVYDATGKLRGADDVMIDLESALDGMSDSQRDAALSSVFSGQAMKGAVDWLSLGSEAYSELEGEIRNSEGAALDMAEIMEDNFGGAMRSLKSAMGTVMIGIGDVLKGPLQDMADKVNKVAQAFNDLDPDKKGLIVKLGALTAAIGPLFKVGSKVLGLFAKYPGILSPVTGVVMAIAGAFTYLYQTNDEFAGRVGEFIDFMGEKLGGVADFIGQVIGQVKDMIGNVIAESTLMDSIQIAFENIMLGVEGLMEFFGMIGGVIVGIWDAMGTELLEVVGTTLGFIGDTIGAGLEVITGLFSVFGSVLQGDWAGAWEGLKGIVNTFIDWFTGIPGRILEIAKSIGTAVSDGLSSAASWVGGKLGIGGGKKHRSGITNVPYDGYPIEAHKGEMLLTKSAADEVRNFGGNRNRIPTIDSPAKSSNQVAYSPNINVTVQGGDKESAIEFERRVERILERERKIFMAKLGLGGGSVEFS